MRVLFIFPFLWKNRWNPLSSRTSAFFTFKNLSLRIFFKKIKKNALFSRFFAIFFVLRY